MKNIIVLMLLMLSPAAFSNEKIKSMMRKLNWNGVDVIYLEDNRFPTYDMVIYFGDGALSDGNHPGETEHAFNLMDTGTSDLTQEKILDQFDFTGTEIEADTTHEFTTLSIAGLSKDLKSTMQQVCHILRDGQYPENVIKKELDKEKSGYMTMVANISALADRANREVSLAGTPYSYPVSGKLKDLGLYNSQSLRSKMDYFLNNVKKRIYLTGPTSVLEIDSILKNECLFKGTENDYERKISQKVNKKLNGEVVFVPVPDANQVQVRIGRFVNSSELRDRNLDILSSDLLGGGFTSKLMREVRVKRGLTYSINSYISSQKEYGRAGINTFTKNETINRLIEVIGDTIDKIKTKGIATEEFERGRSGLVGSHPFKFENNKAFLMQLLYLDHVGSSYDELFNFNEKIKNYSLKDVNKKIIDIFDMKKQTIFILGDKSLENEIKKLSKRFGKVRVLNYQDFI